MVVALPCDIAEQGKHMRWYSWLGVVAVSLVVLGWVAWNYYGGRTALRPQGPKAEAALALEVAAQNEDAFHQPVPQGLDADMPRPAADPLKNVYFGDLHVHTNLSVDSYLFGNRLDVDMAYRIAKGESAEIATGERVALTRPLDFAALTDHAEGFGVRLACADTTLGEASAQLCNDYDTPSIQTFLSLRAAAGARPAVLNLSLFGDDPAVAERYQNATWQQIKEAAERHYQPGKFTTFAGYEYSPTLADRGKHHRNIIFRSMDTPNQAISAYTAASEIEVWRRLEATCTDDCEFLTIPHNPNKTWGLAFASQTIDGIPYTAEDWKLRERSEPLVEMFQIKGNSECSSAFGAGDEECGFEQFLPPCAEGVTGKTTGCIHPTSMIRDGLKKGLALEDELGVNPLKFGLIGSTDAHNSNPGDAEEWDYRGAAAYTSSPAQRRLDSVRTTGGNPGGLAAVWAPENTREALFDAMRRKEVYATSGTRIKLRAFAGFALPADIAQTGDLAAAYAGGVPMGGSLPADDAPEGGALSLFVWAVQDPDSAPLAKIQVIKGWIDGGAGSGESHEVVYDVACGGSEVDPQTGRCVSNGAKVNMADCAWSKSAGASQLKARWTDPDYDASDDAFYYVRVVQNPTCRWSTYDSLRLGRKPSSEMPATSTEMAWASPIWVQAGSGVNAN